MSDAPTVEAWDGHQDPVDETVFTPWAEKGWSAWNGQSPELEVCDFAQNLMIMLNPALVVETGVGQGYMTRALIGALLPHQRLVAFESDDGWRATMWQLPFWENHRFVASLSADRTPTADVLAEADLCIFDSEFEFRFDEIRLWHERAKTGAVCLIHDTADRDDTVHQSVRGFIKDLGMTGVFLSNPRGSFMAVQPALSAGLPTLGDTAKGEQE